MFKQRVQGFAVGAATIAVLMFALPMQLAPSPAPDLEALADSVGVDVVWTSIQPCQIVIESDGCFTTGSPNTIYVSAMDSAEDTKYVFLHELAHVLQYRAGAELSDCNADMIAELLGAEQNRKCHVY